MNTFSEYSCISQRHTLTTSGYMPKGYKYKVKGYKVKKINKIKQELVSLYLFILLYRSE